LTKWLLIVVGIAVLTVTIFFVRFASDSEMGSLQSEHPSPGQMESVASPVLESAANSLERPPLQDGGSRVNARVELTDTTAIQSPQQDQATGSVERMELENFALEAENRGGGMPGLVILPQGSYGAGTGPSQEDFGFPGPEDGAGDLADSAALRQTSESASNGLQPPANNDLPSAGPSQTDLGLPGPGQEETEIIESLGSDAGQTEDRAEDQPLPVR